MEGSRVVPHAEAIKSEIRKAIINEKANASPMCMRVAWHSSGTYCKYTRTGGSDGATMRFEPEESDPANAGLSIIRDMLLPVKAKYPAVSLADIWSLAGAACVEFLGGPKIPFQFGRVDDNDGRRCPPNGRLPDAAEGAGHLREVFFRMGFNDREIVALSGGHTLGRAHLARSGYDGKWTDTPLKFDNSYFKNLMELEWEPREWEGNLQFTDRDSKRLMMLPTDIAIKTDPIFRIYADMYAKDEKLFFKDFSEAYGKLLAVGTPMGDKMPRSERDRLSCELREACMHGHEEEVHALARSGKVDLNGVDADSGRTALHKASFWGHSHLVKFLIEECKVDANRQDFNGDTALHDAARFGHLEVSAALIPATDLSLQNNLGQDALTVAIEFGKDGGGNTSNKKRIISILQAHAGGGGGGISASRTASDVAGGSGSGGGSGGGGGCPFSGQSGGGGGSCPFSRL